MSDLSEINKALVFSIFWSAIWVAAFYSYAKVTGWSVLARHYASEVKPNSFQFRFKVILMRYRLSYEWATHLHATSQGLYPAVAFLFRPGHPCLFIPWNEITIVTEKKFIFQYAVLTTQQAPHICIRIPVRVFSKLDAVRRLDTTQSASRND